MEQSAYDVVERVGFDGYGTGLANAGGAHTCFALMRAPTCSLHIEQYLAKRSIWIVSVKPVVQIKAIDLNVVTGSGLRVYLAFVGIKFRRRRRSAAARAMERFPRSAYPRLSSTFDFTS